MSKNLTSGWIKGFLAVGFCVLWRLFPFRPPNVEPVLATIMPYTRRFGPAGTMLLTFLCMVAYDVLTGTVSQWTAVTALTYMLVSLAAWFCLRGRRGILPYVLFAVPATLFYDFVTGVAAGALLFGMSWQEGFIGQIPFTVNHLIGNLILAAALSPLIERWVVRNIALEADTLLLRAGRT